jgi:fluoride ion exporter CrcB/FEX
VSKNDLANALGWGVIVIGIIGSFLLGNAYRMVSYGSSGYVNGPYNFGVAISGIIASALFGIIFIFIGEILTTEYENRDKIASLYDQMNNNLNKDSN